MRSTSLIAGLGALALAACAGGTDYQPAATASNVNLSNDSARSTVDGVTVVAIADTWPGPNDIGAKVTPMKVRLMNNGSVPVVVRYDTFSLVGPSGRQYAALPPFQVDGELTRTATVVDPTPVAAPGFTYTGFDVAPYFGPVYPSLTAYPGAFYGNSLYYDTYDTAMYDVQLPTPAMRQLAIPEGVIRPGGMVEGWLYFENVPEDIDRVSFRADLTHAETNRQIGEIRIPFVAEDA